MADEKTVLNISRFTVFFIALVALLLSLNDKSSIFCLVSYAWAGFGATFGPLVLLALYWKGATAKGAISGIIGGGITVVVWHNLKNIIASCLVHTAADAGTIEAAKEIAMQKASEIFTNHPVLGLYEIVPGFVVCLILAVVVSLLDKNKDPDMIAKFETYKNMED